MGQCRSCVASQTITQDVVHYGPGDQPPCGSPSWSVADTAEHARHCLACRGEIMAMGGAAWRRVVRALCPHCGKRGW